MPAIKEWLASGKCLIATDPKAAREAAAAEHQASLTQLRDELKAASKAAAAAAKPKAKAKAKGKAAA